MSEAEARAIREEPRFRGIEPIEYRSGETFYPADRGREAVFVKKTDSGENAMGMALRRAAMEAYGGALSGHRVFCSDLISPSMVKPVVSEKGEPVFIDVSPEDWGMDPDVLEIAFGKYRDVKIVIMTHLYGFPAQAERIKSICEAHGALLIEDARESVGASVNGRRTGTFGDYGILSEDKVRMPGDCVLRLKECIEKKKRIYERYREWFSEDLMALNPIGKGAEPNFWTPCMTVESSIGFIESRTERGYEYVSQHGTAAPMEIVDALAAFGIEATPVRKPMHMRAHFKDCDQITLDGSRKEYGRDGHRGLFARCNESAEIFRKGICLPADIGMTREEQERVIDIIFACYSKREVDREVWAAV